jgi:hypothetical protein
MGEGKKFPASPVNNDTPLAATTPPLRLPEGIQTNGKLWAPVHDSRPRDRGSPPWHAFIEKSVL